MTQEEFESLANFDREGPDDEDLVRFDLRGLKEVASGRDSAAKNWLKQFLREVRDTPEVRELKALLH